ncbi:hypothetical protein [Schaalia sp.]|uniref:hypothetical protein n=1 Tax=Schaalia sp. TaxID=2691890 RepID=UPI003D14610E
MSISCVVAVDGRRVADSADSYGARGVALDGLNVRWGRSSRLAQPSPSTCSLRIALPSDRPIGEDLAALAPGARLTVTAEQSSTGGASVHETSSTAPLRLTTTAPAFIDPAPLEADGGNPAAWDDLPRASRGAVYTGRVEITEMPPSATVTLRPAYYAGPFASSRVLGPVIASKSTPGPGILTGRFLPDDSHLGQWVGLAVTANPNGPTWRTAPGTWASTDPKWTFASFGLTLASAATLRREGPASRAATVFAGRITDAPISWDDTLNRPVIDVIAADFTAELANQLVSSPPWPEEPAAARISRIIAAARLNFTPQIDDAPGALLLGPRDVDAQSVANLLRAVAVSTGAILWPTTHAAVGDFIRLEDLAKRRSLYRLIVPPSGPASIETSASGAITVPASQIRRSGLTVQRDASDLATQVAVRWTETTIDQDGEEHHTDHTETASDPDLIDRLGTRSLSISTELARKTDASDLAIRTLARSAPGGFAIPSATWDLKNAPSDLLSGLGAEAFSLNPTTILTISSGTITRAPGPSPVTYANRAVLKGLHYIRAEEGHTYRISLTLTNHGNVPATVNIGAYLNHGLGYRRSLWNPGSKKAIPAHTTIHVVEDWTVALQGDEDTLNVAIYFETNVKISASQITIYDTSAPPLDEAAALTCLDSASRIGAPITLTGVANWVPGSPNIPAYLDGGNYTFQHGRWILGLQLTRAAVPGDSIPWKALPPALDYPHAAALTFADLSSVTA